MLRQKTITSQFLETLILFSLFPLAFVSAAFNNYFDDDSEMYRTMLAACEGDMREIQLMARNNSDFYSRYDASEVLALTPLMAASLNGHSEIVQFLLAGGADVHVREIFGHNALMFAAKNGNAAVARQLIAAGAKVDAINDWGHTALMFAAMRGRTDMAELLLDAGADVNAVDKFGWSVLLHAARRGHVETVKFLLARGAKPLG